MVRRMLALGCFLALLGVVSVASAADSPTTRPATQDGGRSAPRGGFGGGFGAMRRPGAFGGGGMARNSPGPQGEDNQPGPGPRGGPPFGRGGFGPMGGGFGAGGGGVSGGNGSVRSGFGRSFGGGGAASNPQGRDLESAHPFLSRLDALLMAVHRELMQEEDGQPGPGMGMRRGPQQGLMSRFRSRPGRFFEQMGRARMARQWQDFNWDRGFGEWDGHRFDQRGMWGRESFPRRFGPFRGEERPRDFRPYFGRMYDDRDMQRPGFRGGPPPRGFFGRGRFEREDWNGGGFGRFGPQEGRRPMMDRYDRVGPPARSDGFGGGGARGGWMERGGPDREESFQPRRGDDNRFDGGRNFAPQDAGPRGRIYDGPEGADAPAPPPRGRFPSRWDDREGDGR